jgi:hypothetical protein
MTEQEKVDDAGPAGHRSGTERAEQVMENVGERIGDWVSRAVARAREEAEDIWAEAQTVRRGEGRDA